MECIENEVDALGDVPLLLRQVSCNSRNFNVKEEKSKMSLCLSTYKNPIKYFRTTKDLQHFFPMTILEFKHCIFPGYITTPDNMLNKYSRICTTDKHEKSAALSESNIL